MKEFAKKNLVLLIAFILPIALIAIVALSTYVPSLLLSTNYNFVYMACTQNANYYNDACGNYLRSVYSVVDGELVVNPIDPLQDSDRDRVPDIEEKYNPRLFLHDTKKNESREITLNEAQTFAFHELLTSPDGVNVSGSHKNGPDFFLFFDTSSSYGYYLTKGNREKRLNLINSDERYYYRDNFEFIGWVLPGRN